MKLADVILPPPPPAVQRRRQSIIRLLSVATAIAGLAFLVVGIGFAAAAFASLKAGAFLAAALWSGAILVAYLGTGVALCAMFMNRLQLWGGASLASVVEAKRHFVRKWPFASIRLLADLLLHRMTGSGMQSSYWPHR